MRRTMLAGSACGIPAAVTNSGRAELPRSTVAACVAVAEEVLAAPITGIPNSRARGRTGVPGSATGIQIGVTVHN